VSAALDISPAEAAFTDAFGLVEDTDVGRHVAWGAFSRTGLPHRRLEDWRWSDVRSAAPEALSFPRIEPRAPDRDGLFSALNPIEIVFVDGRFAWWPEDDADANRIVREFGAPDAPIGADRLPLGALAAALAPDPQMIILDIKEKLTRPIWLRFIAETDGAARLTRVGINVGPGAGATVLETQFGDGAGFGSTLVECFVRDGARLDRIVVQDGSPEDVLASTADVRLGAGARFNQTTLAFGAKLARFETHVTHEGEGASAVLDGAYLLDGARHADQTTVVTHAAPGATTQQLVKGAVRDKATAAFQGRIVVERGAQKTDARMGHHALLLTEGATVNAKPELVIYADDVQCAHGNTAGAIDEDQLFYLEARGIPEPRAKALVTEAFVAEALERVADERVQEILLGEARSWLEASR
jgi:Fe-S cluster assembly protein SufD